MKEVSFCSVDSFPKLISFVKCRKFTVQSPSFNNAWYVIESYGVIAPNSFTIGSGILTEIRSVPEGSITSFA